VIVRRERPAIFQYTQSFEVEGRALSRTGFVARVALEEFSAGRVIPHERTFPAAKEDRLRLLTAMRVNTSSIFSLYAGSHPELSRLQKSVAARAPMFDVAEDGGIRNELRAIEDAEEIATVQRALEPEPMLIADGHHRYETGLNYRRARRAETAENQGVQPFDYTMMTIVACDDPGLVILPTHRVVRRLDAPASKSFAASARESFDVEEIRAADELIARLRASGTGTIGIALRGAPAHYLLTMRDSRAIERAMPSAPVEVRALDVSILHALIFDRIFGIGADEVRKGGNVEYTIRGAEAIAEVASGAADGAFLMNPPSIDDVQRVSRAGATMPEKSTYFFPKLATGLVMNPLFD